jgi:hypothetical protein
MATTAASLIFSVTTALPALAAQDGEEGDGVVTLVDDSESATDASLDASLDDPPVAKEKTVEYTIQDFAVVLPVNWRIITRYDETSSKPSSTPTLFSAIDFNSGAVISVVREEACSVSEYAKSSFEKSKKNSKKCDFALRGEGSSLFSIETYEKDASKLLIRHDDRDNAVLKGVSSIEDSKLTQNGGFRRSSPSLSGENDSMIDSYSSSLLEVQATTTIPTSGTYRDAMGLEQPNTIARKVLAKAVAITTIVPKTPDATAGILPPPANESTLLATETETPAKESTESESVSDPSGDPLSTTEATTATASVSEAEATKAESDVDTSAIENSSAALKSDATKEAAEINSENSSSSTPSEPIVTAEAEATSPTERALAAESNLNADTSKPSEGFGDSDERKTANFSAASNNMDQPVITLEEPTRTFSNAAEPEILPTSPISSDASFEASTQSANDSPMSAMMAMTATIIKEPTLTIADAYPSADTTPNARSADAVETVVETAIETAIEAARETAIEPVIEAGKETAKETAKELASELLKGNEEPQETTADATATSEIDIPSSAPAVPIASSEQTVSTPDSSDVAIDSMANGEISAMDDEEASDTTLVASESPATANEPPAAAATTKTTVLSIWLSAPLDEWQKPVMGTRLNEIWKSVQYTSDILEASEKDLAMLSEGEDSVNTQLLLLNNKSFR